MVLLWVFGLSWDVILYMSAWRRVIKGRSLQSLDMTYSVHWETLPCDRHLIFSSLFSPCGQYICVPVTSHPTPIDQSFLGPWVATCMVVNNCHNEGGL